MVNQYKQKPFSIGRKHRIKNFIAIPFSASQPLLTLANEIVVSANIMNAVFSEDIWIISMDWIAAIRGLTAGEVPIELGVHHSDLSVTEVAEALDAEVLTPDNIIAMERARRPVRRLGLFADSVPSGMTMHQGMVKRSKIMMAIGNGLSLNFFLRNQSGGALTTGSTVEFHGTVFGRWQR